MSKRKLSKRKKPEPKPGVEKELREYVGYLVELNCLNTTLLVKLSSLAEKIVRRRI